MASVDKVNSVDSYWKTIFDIRLLGVSLLKKEACALGTKFSFLGFLSYIKSYSSEKDF